MKYSFIVLAMTVFSLSLSAQHPFSSSEIKRDFGIFRQALETTYPSLYRYSDSVPMTSYLDNESDSIARPQTDIEFYRHIVNVCAKLNDEHLIPTPPAYYYDSLKNSRHFFPFSIKLIDRRMYVLHGFKLPQQFAIGSEILSINGRSVEEILGRLLSTIPSDGYLQTFNERHLEDFAMTQNENLFDLNYPIFIEDVDTFHVQFLSPSDKKTLKTVTIPGLDYVQYQQFYRERRSWKAPLEFKFLKGSIAYLRILSFHKGHRDAFHQDFYGLYDSIFRVLNKKSTRNLIIDLRNNEGGDGTGEKLLLYLMTKPYRHYDYLEEKFTGYPAVAKYLENGDELFFPDSLVYKMPSGMYRLKKKYSDSLPLFNLQQPSTAHFRGKLYVLINGASGSMAAVVASFLKGNRSAVFIGEECGGPMEGPTSLAYARLVLPHTKIRVEIPLTKVVHALDYVKGRGVIPDHHVTPKIDSLLKGRDDELEFAIHLISQQN